MDSGITEPEENAETVGDDIEGVDKYMSNNVGPWNDVEGSDTYNAAETFGW